jgi:hypothetical protein
VLISSNKKGFSIMDLPFSYCRSRFKDLEGNDILEFNVSYFLSIPNESDRDTALKTYPSVISSYYKKWIRSPGTLSSWVMVPAEIGICFVLFDGHPLFLNVIPATI